MERLGNVQQKVQCVFQTRVLEEPSGKRNYQPYKVVATDSVRQSAVEDDIVNAIPSEKLDGTCVHIREFDDKPWLWARLDRKPNKMAERRFRKFQGTHNAWEVAGRSGIEPVFDWDLQTDLKDVPVDWIPAAGVELIDGKAHPDSNGHIPGWVPIEPKSRQHCWHLTAVDLDVGLGLFLESNSIGDGSELQIVLKPLAEHMNSTLELIGTHINGNPYKLGSKQHPIHLLVRHGSLICSPAPPRDFNSLKTWFGDRSEGAVEGIVWHCKNGSLYKAHRHHLGLKWPVDTPHIQTRSVLINVDMAKYRDDLLESRLLHQLGHLHGKVFPSLHAIKMDDLYY